MILFIIFVIHGGAFLSVAEGNEASELSTSRAESFHFAGLNLKRLSEHCTLRIYLENYPIDDCAVDVQGGRSFIKLCEMFANSKNRRMERRVVL